MVRPKKYQTGQEPTPKERLAKSQEKLIAAGGKMLHTRLTPEGNKALNELLDRKVFDSVTEAINQSLIDRNK